MRLSEEKKIIRTSSEHIATDKNINFNAISKEKKILQVITHICVRHAR